MPSMLASILVLRREKENRARIRRFNLAVSEVLTSWVGEPVVDCLEVGVGEYAKHKHHAL